jgi:leucyl-tRNA synthetase
VSSFQPANIDGMPETLSVFTTRPDTIFGVTYMVLAPEHPLVEKIVTGKTSGSVR